MANLAILQRNTPKVWQKIAGHTTCITDKEQVVAASGNAKKEFLEKHISQQLEDIISKRNTVLAKRQEKGFVPILEVDNENLYSHELITPIISEGDVLGAIIMISDTEPLGELEGKLVATAAGILGKQMEQ